MPDTPYDAIADWYDDYIERRPIYREILLPALLSLTGGVDGREVCDLACGQGFISRELARRGARVTGADISEKLLDLARAYEAREPLGIRYLLDDVQHGAALPDTSFDGAVCSMALMPIPDLAATFATVRRILRPGGWFVFAITHPCFQTPHARWVRAEDGTISRQVGDYFNERYWSAENSSGVRGQVGEYHRTLSTYLNTLIAAGLRLDRLEEPAATGPSAEREPENASVPSLLLVRAVRG